MSMNNFNRRQFLMSTLATGLVYGAGTLPNTMSSAFAAAAPLRKKLVANLFLDGGADFRHLVVPAYNANRDSFGNKYWRHRARSHRISETNESAWQARFNNDYVPITVGGSGWNGNLVDQGSLNSGVTFGIWKEAGWLIDMFKAGNVSMVCNMVGGTNRAHDLSSLQLNQGNVESTVTDQFRSGWGGRLARSAGGNTIALSSTPSPFVFGPVGAAPNYNPNGIDNADLIAVQNSRKIGLFDFDLSVSQVTRPDHRRARTSKSYYAALRQKNIPQVYERFMDHESKVREFGRLIQGRLESVPLPDLIRALTEGVNGINPDPNTGQARRVLKEGFLFGLQIQNFFDIVAANEEVNPRVLSMIYTGWDSHNQQRKIPGNFNADPNNPDADRGIESGFKDIFGGKFGASPSSPSALHGGFSALWNSLSSQADRDNIIITVAGEFGRQIRDNGDFGTDHGSGNMMLVIGEKARGGIYGELFPESEVDKYDDDSLNTPDIDPRTEIDHLFARVCDWVEPNSGGIVFPRTSSGFSGTSPIIERNGLLDSLIS